MGGAVAPLFEYSDEAPDFDVVVPRFADTEEPDFDALADFDLDFVLDLECADEPDRVFILLNSYTGLKQSQSKYKRGNSPTRRTRKQFEMSHTNRTSEMSLRQQQ